MANNSAQPRPEERSGRRRVSKGAQASANGAFVRGAWRNGRVLGGMGVVALAFAASLACADAQLAPSAQVLSPEAPVSFGDLGGASPLLAMFTAAPTARRLAPDIALLAEPKLDLDSSAVAGPQGHDYGSSETQKALGPAPPDIPAQVVYDPTVGPSLSPIQSALQAALWRLVARDDHRNPLGSGDWRAARGGIAAFYASRAYAPIWVAESGLTEAGRAALTQLERARDDGLNLSAFALPRDLGSGLDARCDRRSRNDDRLCSGRLCRAGERVARPALACLGADLRDAQHRRSRLGAG